MLNNKKLLSVSLYGLLAVFLLFATEAKAQSAEPEHYVTFRVLAEKMTVEAGEEIWVGVEQSIYPEWHTYWANPGDSGSAPKHNWSLPEGFEIGDITWPVPKKIPYDSLLNYGYSDSVMLIQKLKMPEKLPAGPITLSVDAEALVCKDICIPEYGTFELVLNNPDNPGEDNSRYFERTLSEIPEIVNWQSEYKVEDSNFVLDIGIPEDFLFNIDQKSTEFLPIDWGVVENAATASTNIQDGTLNVTQKIGERDIASLNSVNGILAYTDSDGNYKGVQFVAKPSELTGIFGQKPLSEKDKVASTGFLSAILFALIGGLILNLMPCVFPVLSLKALSLVKISEKNQSLARLHGLSYTAGVVSSFLLIAGILIVLQAGGQQIGWGFQLQNPIIISLLTYLLFLIGLNLSGFFEIGNTFGNAGQKLTQGDGLNSSFFTGVLATIVATPCTAPFMSVAIGYALLQPAYVSLSVFAALGLGLAFPYLVLSFVPTLQKSMPKPGAWMDIFKQFLAFPMFAFAAWLVWILAQQAGSFGVLGILLGMILLSFAIWLSKVKPRKGKMKTVGVILIALSLLGALAVIPAKSSPMNLKEVSEVSAQELSYETYSPPNLKAALDSSAPVFVEMTAAWCITCKVNHASSINRSSTIQLFAKNNVRYLVGDWTNYDPEITQYLKEFGRNGVPIYVFYGAPDPKTNLRPEPVVLPQILTPAIVANTVNGTT